MSDGTLLFGKPFKVTDRLTVYNPKIEEILEFGEERYFTVVSTLVSTAWDYKLMLHENGTDYVTVPDFEIFTVISRNMTVDDTRLIFGQDIDLSKLHPAVDKITGQSSLLDDDMNVVFDAVSYTKMANYIRKLHRIERVFKIPGNEATRMAYMEDDRRAAEIAKRKKNEFKSLLAPLISAMCNNDKFKYDYHSVQDLSIYTFMDSVHRVQAIQQYEHLMSGIYTGVINATGNKFNKELNWMRELD